MVCVRNSDRAAAAPTRQQMKTNAFFMTPNSLNDSGAVNKRPVAACGNPWKLAHPRLVAGFFTPADLERPGGTRLGQRPRPHRRRENRAGPGTGRLPEES